MSCFTDWHSLHHPLEFKVQKIPKTCVKSCVKKYVNRGSPPYPANDCPNIVIIDEKDSNKKYISLPNKNGVFSWKKLKSGFETATAKQYYEQFGVIETSEAIEMRKKLTLAQKELHRAGIVLSFLWSGSRSEEIQAAFEKPVDKSILKIPFLKKIITKKSDYYDVMNKAPFSYIRDEHIFFLNNKLWKVKKINVILNMMNNENKIVVKDVLTKYFGKKMKVKYQGKNIQSLTLTF